MSPSTAPFVAGLQQARLPHPYRPEAEVVAAALASLQGGLDWPAVIAASKNAQRYYLGDNFAL